MEWNAEIVKSMWNAEAHLYIVFIQWQNKKKKMANTNMKENEKEKKRRRRIETHSQQWQWQVPFSANFTCNLSILNMCCSWILICFVFCHFVKESVFHVVHFVFHLLTSCNITTIIIQESFFFNVARLPEQLCVLCTFLLSKWRSFVTFS